MSFNSTVPHWLYTPPVVSFVSLYILVLIVGLLGNIYISTAIWNQRPVRNLLLINLCTSDIFVCGLSGPVSIIAAIHPAWKMGLITCKVSFFLQSVPVVASTWSLMMLSLDRYTSIKHPRVLARFQQQRHLTIAMIILVWTVSFAVTLPILYSRTITAGGECEDQWLDPVWRTTYTLCHVILVYLLPGLTVAACHHAVGHKLYAVSLSAAAANGDIPLPMPIIAGPKEVILVASVQADAPSKVIHYRHYKERVVNNAGQPKGKKKTSHSSSESKQSRSISEQSYLHKKMMTRQSLQSRRRLANMLVALVVVFATCWLPYVILKLYSVHPTAEAAVIQALLPFFLLLGHTHSAVNPIVYLFLNRQSLNVNTCTSCFKKDTQKEKSGGTLKFLANNRQPSSTNEAALGIFHPRYMTYKTQTRVHQPRETSQIYS